jgi:hypothetical protein
MRPVVFVMLLGVGACESNTRILPASAHWMDWPTQVSAGDPFRTRLVVWQPCAPIRGFDPAPAADASAVTFAPYFVADKDPIMCVAATGLASEMFVMWSLDTAGMAPGLPAEVERTYEMRSLVPSCGPACAGLNSVPWLIFGRVTVRPTLAPPSSSRNAAGFVMAQRDAGGCTRIRPAGLPNPDAAIVLENPTDTTAQWSRWVQGYIYEPAAPVCGATRVFHQVMPPD